MASARLSEVCRRPATILLGPHDANVLSALDLVTTPAATRFCREALALDRRLCRLWHRFRGDPGARGSPLTRAELIAKVLPIEKRLLALGERHLHAANADVRNLAHAFFVHNPHFFTFVHEAGARPRTTMPRETSAQRFNGAQSCSGRGANRVNAPSNVC